MKGKHPLASRQIGKQYVKVKNDAYIYEVYGRGFETKDGLRVHLIEHDPDKVNQRMGRAV